MALRSALQPALHRVGIHQPGLLELELAAGEYGEIGNPLHVVACGELGRLLGIDLEHNGSTGEFARNLRDVRSGHAAWTAPRCPEIDEHRNFAVANDFVELDGADPEGLSQRRKRDFARAASAGIGKVPGRHAIRLTACSAITNDGQGEVLRGGAHRQYFARDALAASAEGASDFNGGVDRGLGRGPAKTWTSRIWRRDARLPSGQNEARMGNRTGIV